MTTSRDWKMASPQTEHGFLKVATELHVALCKTRVPGEARQVLDVIIRKTYGWNKKEDSISLSQFEELTQMPRSSVVRAIHKLSIMGMISYIKVTGKVTKYSVVKDYTKWLPSYNNVTSYKKVTTSSYQSVNKPVTKVRHTIDTNTKDTKQKTVSRRKGRVTWLTPFWDYWKEQLGGKMNAGIAAKMLKPLVDEHGEREVMDKFRAYFSFVRVTGGQPFANVNQFATRYNYWQAGCQYNKTKKGWEVEDY